MSLAALTVKIGADLSDLNKGLTDAQKNVQTFGAGVTRNATAPIQTLTGATASVGTSFKALQGPLNAVTRQLLQLNPAASQMTNILGTLAIGSGPMIAILAGVAAVSFGWKKLTKDADDLKASTDEAIKSLTAMKDKRLLGSSAGTGAREAEKTGIELFGVQRKIAALIPQVAMSASRSNPSLGNMTDPVLLKRLVDLQKEETRLRGLIGEHEDALTDVRVKKAEERAEAVKKANEKAFGSEKSQWEHFFTDLRHKINNQDRAAEKIGTNLPGVKAFGTTGIAPLSTASVTGAPNLTEVPGLTKLQQATRDGFQTVAFAIGTTLAQNLASVFGGGRGAQIGGSIVGAGLGAFAAKQFGGEAGGFLGSFAGPVGTVVGSLLGSAIGSIFDKHKSSVDRNTDALHRLAEVMGAPQGFKVDPYRYRATKAEEYDMSQRGGVAFA